eukprot:15431835-Alexandrium_andersonii.AAC.1
MTNSNRLQGQAVWHLYIEGCPNCNPQSAEGPPVLQSASIHNPPRVKHKIAAGVRTWTCAVPGTASHLVPEAREGS